VPHRPGTDTTGATTAAVGARPGPADSRAVSIFIVSSSL